MLNREVVFTMYLAIVGFKPSTFNPFFLSDLRLKEEEIRARIPCSE